MNNIIKPWLITASAPICGAVEYYCAYSENDPLLEDDFPYADIIHELWENYGYLLHLKDDVTSEEMDLEVDNPEDYEVIYDERE